MRGAGSDDASGNTAEAARNERRSMSGSWGGGGPVSGIVVEPVPEYSFRVGAGGTGERGRSRARADGR